eukprot:CAMPEP_0118923736 /NCGR_PEP_ID=MMETSP1169-20130426/2155_1 /TAXON_ID=36882 /ORGANISM="Pyramimonas obovata, Strain CCMP722" /LENGTH=43 /DNA_ID= /DNA_START= /DNA_END= /DNA_ORIENTATION=
MAEALSISRRTCPFEFPDAIGPRPGNMLSPPTPQGLASPAPPP